MNKKEGQTKKIILNVGYCESNSDWLKRIMKELADENKNFFDLSINCA
tara:strand:+ start:450 stop:593 length:144 start_codon:yes stop_codon:yes gene_type:complete